jgi:hypothetical protein
VFKQTREGLKPYEVRVNDRDYQVGDVLDLWEWCPLQGLPTGWHCAVVVTAITQGRFGLPGDVCVMGFDPEAAKRCGGFDRQNALHLFGVGALAR